MNLNANNLLDTDGRQCALVLFLLCGSTIGMGCDGSLVGQPCERDELGMTTCEEEALLTCEGDREWVLTSACDQSCTIGPGTSHSEISGDETWTCLSGPHRVDAVLTIPAGATLSIEQGTHIEVAVGSRIDTTPTSFVDAVGVDGAPIVFTSSSGTTAGYGSLNQGGLNVFASSSGSSRLDHVIIERAIHGLGVLGLATDIAGPSIQNTTLRDNEGWGILIRGCNGDVVIPDYTENQNRFFGNGEGEVSGCQ